MKKSDSTDIPKVYDPARVEQKWYAFWEKKGYFRGDENSKKPSYCIVMPPPNITGVLHMGHALNITLQDIVIRWKRMQGFNVLWVPGTDHAGIATQNVVERQLAEQGLRRVDLGREKFEQLVWEWREQTGNDILLQMRKLGCSCDWSRTRFTLDEGLSRAVREVFVRLYENGLIYRGEYLVNWCPRCTTAISDLEVEYRPTKGKLWYLKYPVHGRSDSVVVATTRPETMLGDTAVAVHPADERYTHLHGQTVILPLMGREIPVILDSFVDREFGSGVVKVTPGHDPKDFEAGRRHTLPTVKVIGEDGKMTEQAGRYAGLDRYEAREKVIRDLENDSIPLRAEDHDYNLGHCQRCETVVEPLVSTQWFVKVKDLAQPAIRAVEEGHTVFVPENYARVYFEWMRNIHDWCISRQLWWGHRIPAWFCRECEEIIVARETPSSCSRCQSNSLEQESDVLDTWFSSGLWPFSTLGWPDRNEDLQVYYPTSSLITGFEIIFFWVARMMMMGLRFMGEVPFRRVYINGLVRDEKGNKMSKSRGNTIDPLGLIEEYGTDAVRFTLAVMAVPGTDIPFSTSRMAGYRAFCNKIWNAGRFLLLNLAEMPPVSTGEIEKLLGEGQLELEDRWLLGRLQTVILNTNENLEKFRFDAAGNELYHFFWHEFCDWYIELSKAHITSKDTPTRHQACQIATYLMETSLRLLHPFVPFITDELWQRLPHSGESLMISAYPEARLDWIDSAVIGQMNDLQELITSIRTARAENNIDPRKKIPLQLHFRDEQQQFLHSQLHHLENLAKVKPVQFVSQFRKGGLQVQGVARIAEFALLLDEVIDADIERHRLTREVKRLEKDAETLADKLRNADFVQRAPQPVVEATRKRCEAAMERVKKLQEKLDGLAQS